MLVGQFDRVQGSRSFLLFNGWKRNVGNLKGAGSTELRPLALAALEKSRPLSKRKFWKGEIPEERLAGL